MRARALEPPTHTSLAAARALLEHAMIPAKQNNDEQPAWPTPEEEKRRTDEIMWQLHKKWADQLI